MGLLGSFTCQTDHDLDYGCQVVCRSERGLEVGEFLQPLQDDSSKGDYELHGEFVRTLTDQDGLLLQRMNRNRSKAIDACQDLLVREGLPAILLDAELTLDGKGLFFYLSGDVGSNGQQVIDSLAGAFDAEVRITEFADALSEGCGPGCGTVAAKGCGTGGCSTCSLKSSCKS